MPMSERIIFQTLTSDARCYAVARRVARDEYRVTLYQWQPRFTFLKVDRVSTYETNDMDDACNTAVAMVFPRRVGLPNDQH